MAAPAFGSSGTWTSTAGTTLSLAVPASVASGDILVVQIFIDGSTVTVTGPTGFAHAENSPRTVNAGGGGNHSVNVLWKRASASDTGTYDFTLSAAGYAEGQAHRYTGCVASGNPWDSPTAAGDGGATNSTTTPAVSVNTGGPDRLLFFAATNWSGGSWTPPSGFTERTDATSDVTADDKVQAVQGSSGTVQATCSGNDKVGSWLGALIGTTASPAADFGTGRPGGFHPGAGPTKARFWQTPRPYDAVTTQVTAESGTSPLGLSATGAAKKVVAAAGTCGLGLSAAGTARKAAAAAGSAPLGLAAEATARKTTGQAGGCRAGLAASASAAKHSPAAGPVAVGLIGTAVGRKVAPERGPATLGVAAAGTARKSAPQAGVGALPLSGSHSGSIVRTVAGTCTFGLAASAAARKVQPAEGAAGVAVVGTAVAAKRGPQAGLSPLGCGGTGSTRKTAAEAGSASAGLGAVGTVGKIARPVGVGCLPLVAVANTTEATAVPAERLTATSRPGSVLVASDHPSRLAADSGTRPNLTATNRSK